MSNTVKTKQPIPPKPFLGPIFQSDFKIKIGSGFYYDHTYRSNDRIHGVTSHMAIDFDAPIGTPVLAPADGLAAATYSEFALMDEGKNGSPRPRTYKGKPIYFGSGLIVQIWHGKGRYTQFAHLDKINPKIPYYKPEVDKETGDLRPAHLRDAVSTYGKEVKVYKIKKGEILGWSGMTGIGWGKRSYDDWAQGQAYTYYDVPHVHMMVFGKRVPRSRNASVVWDPFGIYGKAAQYPADKGTWHALPNSLWLNQMKT